MTLRHRTSGFISPVAILACVSGLGLTGLPLPSLHALQDQQGISQKNTGLGTVRPIDGTVGISDDRTITGNISVAAETASGAQTSIAIAIGSYSSDSAEDMAIQSGTRGSKNFKVVSLSGASNQIDLSAPWAPGVALPECEEATVLIKVTNLVTGEVAPPVRIRLRAGVYAQIPQISAGASRTGPEGMFQPEPPVFKPRTHATRSASPLGPLGTVRPIDGSFRLENERLTGILSISKSALKEQYNITGDVEISYFSAGNSMGQSLDDYKDAVRRSPNFKNGLPVYRSLLLEATGPTSFNVDPSIPADSKTGIRTERGIKVAIAFKIAFKRELPDAIYRFKQADGTVLVITKKRFQDVAIVKLVIIEVPGAGTVRPIDVADPGAIPVKP